MKKKILFAAACITGSTLFAQIVPPVRQDSSKTLNEIIISVTKLPQKQIETGRVITVITHQELEKNIGKTLPEILNQQVGITVSGANNTLGTNQSIFTRGASSANTLILMDGIPLYDASGVSGEFDLNNFSLNNIERIEILKGAQSTLYGSDAVAGVINIITKKSFTKPVNLSVNFSAGSYDTYKGAVALSGSLPKGQTYFISYNRIDSKGFSSAYDSTGKKNYEKDGFKQDVLQASYGFKLSGKTDIRVYGKYNINHADIDAGAFVDDKDYNYINKNFIGGLASSYTFNKATLHLNYNYNWFSRHFTDDSVYVPPGAFAKFQDGKYTGKSHFAEAYGNWQLNKYIEMLAGVDYRKNETDQKYIYKPDYGFPAKPISADSAATNQYSAYSSIELKNLSGFNAELGGRWNHHSIYGDNFTYSLNPFYILNNNFKFFVNISSGYRVPSLYQLYSEFGNKKLKPETTTSTEGGVQFFSKNLNARVIYFDRSIKNVFAFYTNPTTYASMYINEDKQKDHGIETEFSYAITDKFSASANYTFADGKLSGKNFSGKDTTYFNLYRRPKNTFNFNLGYQLCSQVYLSAHLKIVSKSFEENFSYPPASAFQLNSYYTIDVFGEYQINKKIKFFSDFKNITDQKYFDIRGFNSRRFNFNAGLNLYL